MTGRGALRRAIGRPARPGRRLASQWRAGPRAWPSPPPRAPTPCRRTRGAEQTGASTGAGQSHGLQGAVLQMKTSDVRVDVKLNKAVWSQVRAGRAALRWAVRSACSRSFHSLRGGCREAAGRPFRFLPWCQRGRRAGQRFRWRHGGNCGGSSKQNAPAAREESERSEQSGWRERQQAAVGGQQHWKKEQAAGSCGHEAGGSNCRPLLAGDPRPGLRLQLRWEHSRAQHSGRQRRGAVRTACSAGGGAGRRLCGRPGIVEEAVGSWEEGTEEGAAHLGPSRVHLSSISGLLLPHPRAPWPAGHQERAQPPAHRDPAQAERGRGREGAALGALWHAASCCAVLCCAGRCCSRGGAVHRQLFGEGSRQPGRVGWKNGEQRVEAENKQNFPAVHPPTPHTHHPPAQLYFLPLPFPPPPLACAPFSRRRRCSLW